MSGRLVVSVDDTDKGTKGFKDKTSSLLTRGPGSLRSKGGEARTQCFWCSIAQHFLGRFCPRSALESRLTNCFQNPEHADAIGCKPAPVHLTMYGGVFFSAFLKNWKEVGSPVQTSRHGAKKICDAIDFGSARRIVEVGPGAGNITREILKSLRPDGQLIVFEINRDLCRCLEGIADPRLVVHNLSGFEMANVLAEKADYVVSEIPIATLSNASLRTYYRAIKAVLHERGECIQIQLSLFSYRRVKRFFKTVKVGFTLLNPPPLFIYSCRDR